MRCEAHLDMDAIPDDGQGREEPSGFSNPRMVIRVLSQTCRVTNYAEANEVAHLVPSAMHPGSTGIGMTKFVPTQYLLEAAPVSTII